MRVIKGFRKMWGQMFLKHWALRNNNITISKIFNNKFCKSVNLLIIYHPCVHLTDCENVDVLGEIKWHKINTFSKAWLRFSEIWTKMILISRHRSSIIIYLFCCLFLSSLALSTLHTSLLISSSLKPLILSKFFVSIF